MSLTKDDGLGKEDKCQECQEEEQHSKIQEATGVTVEQCPICHEDLSHQNSEDPVVASIAQVYSCKHTYHNLCMLKWLATIKQVPTCPMDRAEVTELTMGSWDIITNTFKTHSWYIEMEGGKMAMKKETRYVWIPEAGSTQDVKPLTEAEKKWAAFAKLQSRRA